MPLRSSRAAVAALVVAVLSGCGSTVQVRSGASSNANGDELGGIGTSSTGGLPPGSTSATPPSTPLSAGTSTGAGSGTSVARSTPTSVGAPRTDPSFQNPAAGQLSRTGRGWDAKTIKLGFITAEDVHQYVGTLGYNLDPGSVVQDVDAIVRDINAKGGVLGRRLIPVYHDNKTSDVAANPDGVAQANCAYFTQDVKVIGVVSLLGNINTPTLRACLRKSQMPLIGMDFALHDDTSLREAGPYTFSQHANLSELAAPWIARLQAQKYFQGWNTRTSQANTTAPKVGILGDDNAPGKRFMTRLETTLKASGITVASTFTYTDDVSTYGSSMTAAGLRFASAGVTHVMTAPPTAAATLLFMTNAEQQGYRPRYAMSSYLTPQPLAENAPAAQLVGAVGIGWNPGIDVTDAIDPGSQAERDCLARLKRGGVTFSSNQRFAKLAGFTLCDAVNIVVGGASRARLLDPVGLMRGMTSLGPSFALATAYANGLTNEHRTITRGARDLHFESSCTCFKYSGTARSF